MWTSNTHSTRDKTKNGCFKKKPRRSRLTKAEERDDDPTQAAFLHELVNSQWWGKLLRLPTDDVCHLDAEKQEDYAIAKLDQLIELVVTIRMAWIDCPESKQAREVAGRCLEQLQGDISER